MTLRPLWGLFTVLTVTTFFSASASASLYRNPVIWVQTFYDDAVEPPKLLIPVGGLFSNIPAFNYIGFLKPPGVDYPDNFNLDVTIHISDTQIVITNLASGSFCTNCLNGKNGFDFKFGSEPVDPANILGVSVDPASAPTFQPYIDATHFGLQLISPNEIFVDITGDSPLANDQLIVDLSFTAPAAETPLPAAFPLFATGLGALGLLGWRRKRKAAALAAV